MLTKAELLVTHAVWKSIGNPRKLHDEAVKFLSVGVTEM